MKLTGELKLVYRTTMEEVDLDPEEIGQLLLDNVKGDAGSIDHYFGTKKGVVSREAVTIVKRAAGSPEICPINTVIEARISFFEKECTCDVEALGLPHASTCKDFGLQAWSRERAA